MDRARVLLADDNDEFLERVLSLLQPNFEIVGTASNGRELVAKAKQLHPDLIVLDIAMPILSGIDAARELHESEVAAKLVFLTVHEGPGFVRACFCEGGSGYVIKSRLRKDLVPAINEALLGHSFISPTLPR